jgi:osmoprotectant transport system permease protein
VGDHAVGAWTEARHVSDLINFIVDNFGLLMQKGLEHIGLSALAIGIAILLALPTGVLLGHLHRFSLLAINISNVLRALPSLALIAIALAFFGLSRADITIALVALALPPILTNAYTAVDHVEPDAVEAARGMGMSERQVLFGVELPLSWPLIFAGIRTAAVYVIATAPLAGIAGGGGYGDIILNQPTYGLEGVIAATIFTVALAFAADAALGWIQRRLTPAGMRVSGQLRTIVPPTESDVPAERAVSLNP